MQYSYEFHNIAFYSRIISMKNIYICIKRLKQYSNVLNGRPIDTQASLLFYSGHKMLFFLQTLLITFILV